MGTRRHARGAFFDFTYFHVPILPLCGDCIGSKELWRRNDEKRIISLLMTFCLVFSVMPTSSAMAESEEADITGGTRQSGGVPVYVCAETMY